MGSGKYIECDNCGAVELTSRKTTMRQFRKTLSLKCKVYSSEYVEVNKEGWCSTTVAGKGIFDFCSKSCYSEWKNLQEKFNEEALSEGRNDRSG